MQNGSSASGHLNELTAENINTGTHFPDALAFGRMYLTYQNWKGYIPRLIPFPFKKSLWLLTRLQDTG